jgi:isopenicillin-N N-acyltransferase-like protein
VREALLKMTGRIGVDDVKAALFDDFATPYAVCAPPQPRDSSIAATVAMIVMQPQQGFMEVAPMPALNRQFTRYDLKMESSVRAVA